MDIVLFINFHVSYVFLSGLGYSQLDAGMLRWSSLLILAVLWE